MVAPNRESSCQAVQHWTQAPKEFEGRAKLPNPPPRQPHAIVSTSTPLALRAHLLFSSTRHIPITRPTKAPPTTEATVPPIDIPPFVPAGTFLNVVMSLGCDRERIPSSDARVSPKQHEKCLYHNQLKVKRTRSGATTHPSTANSKTLL
jgi:hypothetical protein